MAHINAYFRDVEEKLAAFLKLHNDLKGSVEALKVKHEEEHKPDEEKTPDQASVASQSSISEEK